MITLSKFVFIALMSTLTILPTNTTAETIDVTEEDNRIIGGTNVVANTYPWFTMLLYMSGTTENEQGCGGMLVSPEWVLTAAHCIDNALRKNGAVRIGALKSPYKQGNNGGQDVEFFKLQTVITHPQYNSQTTNNDYALLRLNGKSSITPVDMDDSGVANSFATGRGNIWAIGLGNTSTSGQNYPSQLKHVEVKYVTNSDCTSKYGYSNGDITSNMLCARDDNQDSCQGDSGGPLYDGTTKKLIGVVSWGEGCADSRFPGVYARVSSKYSWIKSTICDNSDQPPSWCGNSPVAAPVASPVAAPVSAPVAAPVSSPTSSSCDDTPLRFQLKVNGRKRFKNCVWVRKNRNRCNLDGASENCPSTCGSCSTCADAPYFFKVKQSGKFRNKNCSWANPWRCDNINGLAESCRFSCGLCSYYDDDYYYYDDYYYDDDF